MIDTMLNRLFRCAHRRLTRPFAPITKAGQPHSQSYVVCLDCGKQFEYDLTSAVCCAIKKTPLNEVSLMAATRQDLTVHYEQLRRDAIGRSSSRLRAPVRASGTPPASKRQS